MLRSADTPVNPRGATGRGAARCGKGRRAAPRHATRRRDGARVRLDVGDQHVAEVAMIQDIEEMAEALHPRDMAERGRGDQPLRIDDLDQRGEDRCDVVEAATSLGVAHQLERCRLGRGHAKRPAGPVLLDDSRKLAVLARCELYAHLAAKEGSAVRPDHHMKALWALVSRPVKLGRAQERHVTGLTEMMHQLRDELVRWQAPKTAVLGGHDHVEALVGVGDRRRGLQSPKRRADGWDGTAQRPDGLGCGEVAPPARGKLKNVLRSAGYGLVP